MRMAATAILYFMFFNFSNNRVFLLRTKIYKEKKIHLSSLDIPFPLSKEKEKEIISTLYHWILISLAKYSTHNYARRSTW